MVAIRMARPMLRVWWTQTVMAWWYGSPMLKRYKPLVRATFAAGDQVDEARFLAEAGYHVAALGLCRTAIETRIRRAALLSPQWNKVRKGWRPHNSSWFLFEQGLWPKESHNRFDKLYSALSKVTHGGSIPPFRVWELLAQSAELMRELDRLVVRSMHMGGASCHAG